MSGAPLTASRTFVVTDDDTAVAVGSGTLQVLGTPRLFAWCEATTCEALEPTLPAGSTSVGTRVSIEHRAASPVGQQVAVLASTTYVDGRLHRFTVSARHLDPDGGPGALVATAEITRLVVETAGFLARL